MDTFEDVLTHVGIKGMRWGVRRTRSELASNTSPGHSEDAKRHQESLMKVASGGTHALSDKEFKDLVGRMQMHQQYSDLISRQKPKSAIIKGHEALRTGLGFADTAIKIYNLANNPATKAGLKVLSTATKTGK